jgi:hypothetical protein
VKRNCCHYPKVDEPIFRQNRTIHDFDEKTAYTGMNVDGYGGMAEAIRSRQRCYVPVAAVLCRTEVRPPEPTMQTTTIIHHGRIGLLSFFSSSSSRGAEYFSYYRPMPWIDSTKKIWRKTASGNSCFAIYRAQKRIRRFLRHGEENAGYLLISAVFLLTTFSNIRTAMCFEYSKKRETNRNDY